MLFKKKDKIFSRHFRYPGRAVSCILKPPMSNSLPYDGLLYVSFGGPEGPEDVLPFLRNVTRGRGVPEERLVEVAHHYDLFHGNSPLNDQNRAVIAALQQEFTRRGLGLPIWFANRNWHPFLTETLTGIKAQRLLAFVTSAFSSYSGCRQYREDLEQAREAVPGSPPIDKIRVFYNHPGFLTATAERVQEALAAWPPKKHSDVELIFTAHSIPDSMARHSDYEAQLNDAGALIANRLGHPRWRLAFQSRSGPPQVPWLGPDILEVLRQLRPETRVVIMPLGFLNDHLEVLYDLDVEARQLAAELKLDMRRAATVGCHPAFIGAIADLVQERLDPTRPKLAEGKRGPKEDTCPETCCLNPITARPGRIVPQETP